MDETTPLLQNQSYSLTHKRLLTIFPALALIQFISFLDQTAISTSLPAIASALDTGASISLVSASFLITSTSIQLVNGRLSDIFGRKASLAPALTIMSLGNLLSGFAGTPAQLFAARAFTGFGAGAINALVQIAIADITTLRQRGYYFGMIGLAVALGNGLGPVVGGVLTQSVGWRWAFWFVCPLCVLAVAYLISVWPYSRRRCLTSMTCSPDRMRDKLKMVDWAGAWASLFGISLLLIPISHGGSLAPWASPAIFCMLIAGVLLLALFWVIQLHTARLPLMPSRLFQYNKSTNILICVNLIIGWIYWGNLFVMPLYLQNVHGASPVRAGILMLPMVVAHGVTSAGTGILISRLCQYKSIIVTGAVCWALASIEKMHYGPTTPIWRIVIVGIFDGVGVGCSLQPVLVGLFAGSDLDDRAVLTGLRNFVRDMGGATSITVSGAILSNMLSSQLRGRFAADLVAKLTSSVYALEDLKLTTEDKATITEAYVKGLKAVFASFAVLVAVHLCACACIRDYGLEQGQKTKQRRITSD